MGRKPHALILRHFERGTKLNDNSNRYEQTCKSCGENFPKGRLDSLQQHIIKKCPALSLEARQNAALQLNDLPIPEGTNIDVPLNGPTLTLPIGTQHWTALETLAEVSRQIDMNEKHDDRSVNNKSAGGSRSSEPPRGDRLELQEQYTLDNPPVSYNQRGPQARNLNAQKAQRRESETSLQHPNFGYHKEESRSESPNLAMAAAAAARFQPSMVDPQLLGDVNPQTNIASAQKGIGIEQALSEASAAFNEDFIHHNPVEQQLTWPMVDGSGGHQYSEASLEQTSHTSDAPRANSYSRNTLNAPTLTTEFSAEYGNGQKPQKHKVRGHFEMNRRKEVQAVRKLGACIRCRMLKKPCSQGDPCKTCASVESARLWKTPCVRTRVADLLEVYSAGLHHVLAYHDLSRTKNLGRFRPSAHQIEATHYPDSNVYATFDSLEVDPASLQSNIDPDLNSPFSSALRMFDTESGENLPTKLENYTKRMSSMFFKNEPSKFMHVTLTLAERLANEKTHRLLASALELWSIVHILVDHELTWRISERVNIDASQGQGPAIQQGNDTYNLLIMQLNAASEKKAAAICKSVLGDLERGLLQRTQGDAFEIFLTALITLNCVEKSTWLFKSWEQESFKSRWPLDKKPSVYAAQGDNLTSMLNMLMRMRNIPPKTYARRDNGLLATDDSYPGAKAYYEQLQLSYDDVLSKQANHTFDPANSRCYELRFCSRLLLPANN